MFILQIVDLYVKNIIQPTNVPFQQWNFTKPTEIVLISLKDTNILMFQEYAKHVMRNIVTGNFPLFIIKKHLFSNYKSKIWFECLFQKQTMLIMYLYFEVSLTFYAFVNS
jgi:hypothetical protein